MTQVAGSPGRQSALAPKAQESSEMPQCTMLTPLSPHHIVASSYRRASPVPFDRGVTIDVRRCASLGSPERTTGARWLHQFWPLR